MTDVLDRTDDDATLRSDARAKLKNEARACASVSMSASGNSILSV